MRTIGHIRILYEQSNVEKSIAGFSAKSFVIYCIVQEVFTQCIIVISIKNESRLLGQTVHNVQYNL